MRASPAPSPVRAAGCIVWRMGSEQPEVLLVHRPRWEDWSFPKGKLDRDEPAYAAALREVEEETGLRVRLGPRLPDTEYAVSGNVPRKVVHYWCARAPKHADITGYVPNAEIDDLRWVPVSRAERTLSYPYDSDLLDTFLQTVYDTSPLLVLRHAHVHSRTAWSGDDTDRPLEAAGREEAHRLVGLLAAYGVKRVVSSDALRCVDTVLPFLNAHRAKLRLDPSLSEQAFDSGAMSKRVRKELAGDKRTVICSHRPVLPEIQAALGVEPVALEPAALLVLHRRDGKVHSIEHYPTPLFDEAVARGDVSKANPG